MKSPEFVDILKDLGFDKVKTHMAVIDDADQMVLEVRLNAAGYRKSGGANATGSSPIKKKGPIRKRSLQKTGDGGDDAATAVADERSGPSPEATSSPIRKKSPIRRKTTADRPAADRPAAEETPPAAAEQPTAEQPTAEQPTEREPRASEPATTQAPLERQPTGTRSDERPAEPASTDAIPQGAGNTEGRTPEVPKTGVPKTAAAAGPAITAGEEGRSESDAGTSEGSDKPVTEPPAPVAPTEADPTEASPTETGPTETGPTAEKPAAAGPSAVPSPVAESGPNRGPLERTIPAASKTEGGEATPPTAPLERDAPAASATPPAKPPEEQKPSTPERVIRRLPQPERRAKILGRIELPKETISDASRRSAPGGPRNPGSVARNLRQAAMQQFRNRGAQKGGFTARRGPGMGRGISGSRGGRGGPKARLDPLAPPPGIDPNKLVQVEAPVSVKKLSEGLGHRVNQLLLVLMKLGVTANINSYLDKDQVELVALELSRNVEVVEERAMEDELISKLAAEKKSQGDEDLTERPPIITFMGHVDHGKTTLLDALRGSDVTKGEAGGITQHVGAYRIERKGHKIVIMDTPGHAAFTQMRARGAQLTDIVVLIVAADDGVMPQTEEALSHAKAAEVPIIVAVNKCDKPDANPMRARQQLATLGLQPEEWGGDVQFIDISALAGDGLDELVEKISLEAEILELKAHPEHAATGTVIEAKQTPAQGNVISLLVMDGTLKRGDLVLCGSGTGRIRVLLDDHGKQLDSAGPGTPVEVLGLPELPHPGDKFFVVKDTKMAKTVATQRASKERTHALAEKSKARTMDLKSQLLAQKKEQVRLIIKADVMGSLEPIRHSLEDLAHEEVAVRILHSALGGITETDVALADASKAVIVGFNSVPDEKARAKADEAGVTIKFYNVIYELIDDARKLVEGLLSPEEKEEIRGHVEVRRMFKSSKFGNIAGCYVTDGVVGRNHQVRLSRDGIVVYTGRIASLRREKDDAREVKSNFECGILLKNYDDLKEGDILETFEIIEIKRTLGDAK